MVALRHGARVPALRPVRLPNGTVVLLQSASVLSPLSLFGHPLLVLQICKESPPSPPIADATYGES